MRATRTTAKLSDKRSFQYTYLPMCVCGAKFGVLLVSLRYEVEEWGEEDDDDDAAGHNNKSHL